MKQTIPTSVEKGKMTPEIQWSVESDLFYHPTRKDCDWAAWHFMRFGFNSPDLPFLFWTTLRDMMLHGY